MIFTLTSYNVKGAFPSVIIQIINKILFVGKWENTKAFDI